MVERRDRRRHPRTLIIREQPRLKRRPDKLELLLDLLAQPVPYRLPLLPPNLTGGKPALPAALSRSRRRCRYFHVLNGC
jgi:hypothetical protein